MFAISWFDIIPVAITFLSIAFVQLLNVYLHVLGDNTAAKVVDISETDCAVSGNGGAAIAKSGSISPTASNGKLEKQASLLDGDRWV